MLTFMTTASRPETHRISLLDSDDVERSELGSIHRVTADSFPILKNLSIKRLVLNPVSYTHLTLPTKA